MTDLMSRIGEYVTRLMSGGTFEIVLLIVLVVVALILFLVALWILWKLLIVLGKGLLWLSRAGFEVVRGQRRAGREARLAGLPPVATGWDTPPGIGLRRALAEARRRANPDALRIVVVAGEGMSDLCRGLGLKPPGPGAVRVAAGGDTVLIDASKAQGGMLRRLAATLPWRRPVDAVAVLVEPEGVPGEALARATSFARATGMRTALHLVFANAGKVAAWRPIDAHDHDADTLCTQLAADAARTWLNGGSRDGLKALVLARSRGLPAAIDRALAAAPSSLVDIASLCCSGAGLGAAVAQTAGRTRPATASGFPTWLGVAVLGIGAALAGLAALSALDRASALRAAVETASREAAVPWTAEGIDTVPSGARVRRISGLSERLAKLSDVSPLIPLEWLVPNHSAPETLGAAFLEGYVLRPLAAALERQARERLAPSDTPERWLDDARLVGEWLAAWEGLAEDPGEVDIRRLFVTAFGGDRSAWSEGTDLAIIRTRVELPPASLGGLDVDDLIDLARSNFVTTMRRWAVKVYTNGPVASAARRAIDRSAGWREQHAALSDLRTALQDPSQQWLTAARDRPDHRFELRVLGRAVALGLLGQANALEAKAAISRIRIDAREAAGYFLLPTIGPLMVRSVAGASDGGGASLSMSPQAQTWLGFLDRIANAGFADLPKEASVPLTGPVSVDPIEVAQARRGLRVFARFASDLPAGLPPVIAQELLRELASELVVGITISVEQALRPAPTTGIASEQAQRLSRVAPSLDDLAEIEGWMRAHHAGEEADRVLSVRARVAAGVLAAGAEVLVEEDPIGVYLDPAADGNALVRRFERGLTRLRRVHELAAPFIEAAVTGGGASALEWHGIAQDLEAYERGDPDAVLSGLEGMLRAYVEDPAAACTAPRVAPASARNDYIARAFSRFRSELDNTCVERHTTELFTVYGSLVEYFDRHVSWLWPWSGDPNAPEIPPSTMAEFVRQLRAARAHLVQIGAPFADMLVENADFWTSDDDGGAAVRFRIAWRARPSEERLAENVIAYELEGAGIDEDGIYTWRYGAPLALKVRLAKNSPYRFPGASDPEQRTLVITGDGNGALLRVFSALSNGNVVFEAPVVDDTGARRPLRFTARVTHADGSPMSLPRFDESALMASGGTADRS